MASQRREVALGRNMERIDIMGNRKQQAIIAVAETIVLSGCGLIKPRDAGSFRFPAEGGRIEKSGNRKPQAMRVVAETIVLCGGGLIEPRDAGYFRFHAEESRQVGTRCERGQETGSDGEAAAQAVAELDAAAGRQSGR